MTFTSRLPISLFFMKKRPTSIAVSQCSGPSKFCGTAPPLQPPRRPLHCLERAHGLHEHTSLRFGQARFARRAVVVHCAPLRSWPHPSNGHVDPTQLVATHTFSCTCPRLVTSPHHGAASTARRMTHAPTFACSCFVLRRFVVRVR